MFARIKLSTAAALFAAMVGLAPLASAQDAPSCACLCMEGSPQWTCTGYSGFLRPPDAPPECATQECPGVEPDPVVDTGTGGTDTGGTDTGDTGDTDTGTGDDVADTTIEPPAPGLSCNYRRVYRPDLGKYKRYKVCRPEMTDEQKARIAAWKEKHAERLERLRAKRAERIAAWQSNKNRRHSRHRKGGDD